MYKINRQTTYHLRAEAMDCEGGMLMINYETDNKSLLNIHNFQEYLLKNEGITVKVKSIYHRKNPTITFPSQP
jgi:hypothetical protein